MGSAAHRKNRRKLALLVFLVVVAAAAYLFTDVSFANERLFRYAMKIRIPKLIAMLVTAAAIGGASIVFQSVINNTIVTPCLLGMNSLYTLDPHRGRVCGGIGKFPCGEREHFLCGGPCFDGSGGDSHLQLSVP